MQQARCRRGHSGSNPSPVGLHFFKRTTGNARSEVTRTALIQSATDVFARSGFEAVGTREIAAAAGVHPALIGYHFGSKDGLYLAVFEHMASLMEQRIGPALAAIHQAMDSSTGSVDASQLSLSLLGQLSDAMLATLADEASGTWGPLMMREQQAPSAAFDLIYERFLKRVLEICDCVMSGIHASICRSGLTQTSDAREQLRDQVGSAPP